MTYYEREEPLSPELLDEGVMTEGATTEELAVRESSTLEANGDDLADMFEVPGREDLDIGFDDLVSVSEEDIFGEGGEDMSDILEVSPEDVMGEDLVKPTPSPQPKRGVIRRVRRVSRPNPPEAGMRGLRY